MSLHLQIKDFQSKLNCTEGKQRTSKWALLFELLFHPCWCMESYTKHLLLTFVGINWENPLGNDRKDIIIWVLAPGYKNSFRGRKQNPKDTLFEEIVEYIFLDRGCYFFYYYTHVGILHCMVFITICWEAILSKYIVFIIWTVKGKKNNNNNEAEYLSKYLHINYK